MLHFAKIPKKFGENLARFSKNSAKFWQILQKFFKKAAKISAISNENFEIRERCKGVHCVDLGESFPTNIYLQNLASIQPRTSPNKFVSSSSRSFNFSSRALPPTWPRPKYCVPQAPPKMRTLRPTGTAAWPARFSQTLSRSDAATNHVFFSGSYLGSDYTRSYDYA